MGLLLPIAFYLVLRGAFLLVDRVTHRGDPPWLPIGTTVLLAAGSWTIGLVIVLGVFEPAGSSGPAQVAVYHDAVFVFNLRGGALLVMLGAPIVAVFLTWLTSSTERGPVRGGWWFGSVTVYVAAWLTLTANDWFLPTA